jgi:hypothetical protein
MKQNETHNGTRPSERKDGDPEKRLDDAIPTSSTFFYRMTVSIERRIVVGLGDVAQG